MVTLRDLCDLLFKMFLGVSYLRGFLGAGLCKTTNIYPLRLSNRLTGTMSSSFQPILPPPASPKALPSARTHFDSPSSGDYPQPRHLGFRLRNTPELDWNSRERPRRPSAPGRLD